MSDKIADKDTEIQHLKARIAALEAKGPIANPAAASPKTSAASKPAASKPAATKPAATKKTASNKPDDLKKVSGIGPKIADLLKAEGIDTFAKLAKTDVKKIQEILEKAGPRYALADASSWPEQAQLLAEGKLDALELLQASLKK